MLCRRLVGPPSRHLFGNLHRLSPSPDLSLEARKSAAEHVPSCGQGLVVGNTRTLHAEWCRARFARVQNTTSSWVKIRPSLVPQDDDAGNRPWTPDVVGQAEFRIRHLALAAAPAKLLHALEDHPHSARADRVA